MGRVRRIKPPWLRRVGHGCGVMSSGVSTQGGGGNRSRGDTAGPMVEHQPGGNDWYDRQVDAIEPNRPIPSAGSRELGASISLKWTGSRCWWPRYWHGASGRRRRGGAGLGLSAPRSAQAEKVGGQQRCSACTRGSCPGSPEPGLWRWSGRAGRPSPWRALRVGAQGISVSTISGGRGRSPMGIAMPVRGGIDRAARGRAVLAAPHCSWCGAALWGFRSMPGSGVLCWVRPHVVRMLRNPNVHGPLKRHRTTLRGVSHRRLSRQLGGHDRPPLGWLGTSGRLGADRVGAIVVMTTSTLTGPGRAALRRPTRRTGCDALRRESSPRLVRPDSRAGRPQDLGGMATLCTGGLIPLWQPQDDHGQWSGNALPPGFLMTESASGGPARRHRAAGQRVVDQRRAAAGRRLVMMLAGIVSPRRWRQLLDPSHPARRCVTGGVVEFARPDRCSRSGAERGSHAAERRRAPGRVPERSPRAGNSAGAPVHLSSFSMRPTAQDLNSRRCRLSSRLNARRTTSFGEWEKGGVLLGMIAVAMGAASAWPLGSLRSWTSADA